MLRQRPGRTANSRSFWHESATPADRAWVAGSVPGAAIRHPLDDSQLGCPLPFEQVSRGYEITAGQNAVGGPATVLKFDQHVIRGVSSGRFTLERELATNERDPAYSPEAPPGVT